MVWGESMSAGPTLFEGKDALWHCSAAALTLSLMILAVSYCVTASNRTSCGNNRVLTLRIKTSNALLKVVVTGSGLRIVELADRRVVRQLNTIIPMFGLASMDHACLTWCRFECKEECGEGIATCVRQR